MIQSQIKQGFQMFKTNKQDYTLTPRELFIESQKDHLKLILDRLDWDSLNSSGNGMVENLEYKVVSNKFLRYYYTGDFDVLDTSCIKKGCHKESIHHLPSYMVCSDYAEFVINMIQGKKFNRNTGYKGLDSVYPESIKINIMARVSNVSLGEKAVLFHNNRPVEPVEESQRELYKQINDLIKDYNLPLKVRLYNNIEKQKAQVLVYSIDERYKDQQIFEFCFSNIKSLEIVIADGLQIDSRKL